MVLLKGCTHCLQIPPVFCSVYCTCKSLQYFAQCIVLASYAASSPMPQNSNSLARCIPLAMILTNSARNRSPIGIGVMSFLSFLQSIALQLNVERNRTMWNPPGQPSPLTANQAPQCLSHNFSHSMKFVNSS